MLLCIWSSFYLVNHSQFINHGQPFLSRTYPSAELLPCSGSCKPNSLSILFVILSFEFIRTSFQEVVSNRSFWFYHYLIYQA